MALNDVKDNKGETLEDRNYTYGLGGNLIIVICKDLQSSWFFNDYKKGGYLTEWRLDEL